MSRIPFWRIIVFGRHGIVLPGQAEPRQIMLNRNSVKLNSTFLRIQEEPPPKSGGLFLCSKAQSPRGISPNARKSPSYFVRRHYLFVLPKRLSLKQGTHIETGSVIHRYAMFQSVFYRICCASSISSTIGDAIGRTIH